MGKAEGVLCAKGRYEKGLSAAAKARRRVADTCVLS